MRPLKLELEGFTCYRRLASVDFTDLDLFAISGPTGAGKSSIMDGITYALYGRVPRLGSEIKELINQGSQRLRVSLEFAVDGERYRVVRATAKDEKVTKPDGRIVLRRAGPPQVQLQQFDRELEDWAGEADRVREVDAKVEELLGLDFEGFTRSVLLPQGRFAEFLAGQPEQRRKVLSDLLRLDIYAGVMQKANAEASQAELGASQGERRLEEDYADATPEKLRGRRHNLEARREEAESLRAERRLVEEARTVADAMDQAAARTLETSRELARAQGQLEEVTKTLGDGQKRIGELVERIGKVDEEMAASGYDREVERRLGLALTPAKELEKAKAGLATNQRQEEERRKRLDDLLSRQRKAGKALADAAAAASLKEDGYEAEKQRNMAMQLRGSLQASDACPVCGQAVASVPLAEHVTLDDAKRARDRAKELFEEARQGAEKAKRDVAVAERELESLRDRLSALEGDCDRWREELQEKLDSDGPDGSTTIQAALEQQRGEKQRYESADRKHRELKEERRSLVERYEGAKERAARLRGEVSLSEREAEKATSALAEARQRLMGMAQRQGWRNVLTAVEEGGGVESLLLRWLESLESQLRSLDQGIGAAKTDVERIEAGIEQAKRIRGEVKTLRERASLMKQLADLLRANRFVEWLIEAALRVLAEDGSRHLLEVSNGRYEFDAQGQEFLVVDHWNADAGRSVKTLSGGESFLASLALALALSERLPELGASRRRAVLDSLFLDEGFGNLDEETLDVVVSALENVMNQGKRMVGVITHLRPLAERMPVSIDVVKSESGSEIRQGV